MGCLKSPSSSNQTQVSVALNHQQNHLSLPQNTRGCVHHFRQVVVVRVGGFPTLADQCTKSWTEKGCGVGTERRYSCIAAHLRQRDRSDLAFQGRAWSRQRRMHPRSRVRRYRRPPDRYRYLPEGPMCFSVPYCEKRGGGFVSFFAFVFGFVFSHIQLIG